MKTSNKGIDLIKSFELLRLEAYRDSAGILTIGYGHTKDVLEGEHITTSNAILLLKNDIENVEQYINSKFELKQCQFDALVSLLFNIGYGNFKKYKLYALLKDIPDSRHIADEWIEFRNAGGEYLRGLLRRRLAELSLYYSW